MAEIPPQIEKPVFSINQARVDIFHLPVHFSLFGLIGLLIISLWAIPYMIEKRGLYHGLAFLPFIPFISALLFFFVIPGSKHDYIHVYKDGIEYRSLFFKGLKNSYFSQLFTPYKFLTITLKSIVGIKYYFFKDSRERGAMIVAPDIAEKLFPYIKEQAGEEKWSEIFEDNP